MTFLGCEGDLFIEGDLPDLFAGGVVPRPLLPLPRPRPPPNGGIAPAFFADLDRLVGAMV